MLKLLFGSKVDILAGSAGELAGSANDLTRNVNDQIGSNRLGDILSVGKNLAYSGTFANYTAAFSTIYATYKDNNASEDNRALIKQIEEANGKLSSIEETNSIAANIKHQNGFGNSVYNFVSQQTRINQRNDETLTTASKPDEPRHDHYFFVLHPSDDWHPTFDKARKDNRDSLPGFIGYTTDRFALGLYLRYMREAIGPGPTLHVLIPSASKYRLPGVVDVDPAILPLVIQGQKMHDGQPYCTATIIGLDNRYIVSVENLPVSQSFDDRKGGYQASSEGVIFQAPATLLARCRTKKGTYNPSSIDLDKLLGVQNGAFRVGGKNFSNSVTNATLDADGSTLRATISQPEGPPKACAINLESFISNDDGVLREYGKLSPSERLLSGAAGTLGGIVGATALGAIGGPVGALVGAGLGAGIIGAGVEEDFEVQKKKDASVAVPDK